MTLQGAVDRDDPPDAGAVHFRRQGRVAFITFDRPAARNAMTWSMYEQLDLSIERLGNEAGLRVAVLRGAGGSFVAGTDIKQFSDFTSGEDGVVYERRLEAVLGRLETTRVPTVAVVERHAVGGGLAIAAVCDLRICTPDARFGMPIARTVGNCLSVANHARLLAHLGPARVKKLLLLAEMLDAEEARASGFVAEVVEVAQLDARVGELCERIAEHAPITLQVTKASVQRVLAALAGDGDDLVHWAYGSRDFREGVGAFLEKRSPRWEGR